MRRIRASARLALLVVWILAFASILIVTAILTFGRSRAVASLGARLMTTFSAGLCAILGIHVTAVGQRPHGPCLVAPNHWGYVDMFVLGSLFQSRFVARADVANWPVMGFFAKVGGTLFIERAVRRDAARVSDEIGDVLRAGGRVTVFLEGGAGDGLRVRPFKSSLIEPAVATGSPCIPAAIVYTLPRDPEFSASRAVAWVDPGFVPHLWRLMSMRRIDASVTFLAPRSGTERKALSQQLEDDVRAAVERVPTSPARTPGPSACTR